MAEAHAAALPNPDRTNAIRRVFAGLLIANLAVVAAKVAIGARAGSLAVLGDSIHSAIDALNNVVFIALTNLAARAPDAEHPYGHGKFEVVGALGIAMFLSISCFELVKNVISHLIHGGAAPRFSKLDLVLLTATLALNLWVAWYENRRGKQLGSTLLVADAAHTKGDVIITVGVIAGAVFTFFGLGNVDPFVALIVTALVARIGYQIVRGALPVLVDERARESDAIRTAAEGVSGVASAYAIRSRSASGVVFAELTIGVAGSLAVDRAHAIADAVEERLRKDLSLDQVTVHIEPC